MAEIINLQITMFLMIAVGVFLRRRELVSQEGQRCLTDLIINVILPCNIIKAFCIDFSQGMEWDILMIILISVVIQAVAVVYGKVIFRAWPEGEQKNLRYATICSNGGFLGNPISEGVFGSYGLLLASVFLIPLRFMMWSEGIAIYTGIHDRKSAIRRAATHPCILACGVGLVLMATGLRFPAPMMKAITYLGTCNTGLSMLIIGMILSKLQPRDLLDKTALIYSAHRLIILPLMAYGFVLLLPASREVRGISVLLTAMPAGATTSILALKYDVEPEFSSKLVICSVLLSLPTLAVWSLILK